jgi:hypothetical protein
MPHWTGDKMAGVRPEATRVSAVSPGRTLTNCEGMRRDNPCSGPSRVPAERPLGPFPQPGGGSITWGPHGYSAQTLSDSLGSTTFVSPDHFADSEHGVR